MNAHGIDKAIIMYAPDISADPSFTMKFFIFLIFDFFCLNIFAAGSFPYESNLFTPSPKDPFTGYMSNIKKIDFSTQKFFQCIL